jgi:hypothetical protein
MVGPTTTLVSSQAQRPLARRLLPDAVAMLPSTSGLLPVVLSLPLLPTPAHG